MVHRVAKSYIVLKQLSTHIDCWKPDQLDLEYKAKADYKAKNFYSLRKVLDGSGS